MKQESALLDTGFFIRLLSPEDELHNNAVNYFRYFLEHDVMLKVSTIAIAEYCVKGDITDLPLKNVMVLPFNYNHAIRAGEMMSIVYEEKKRRGAVFSHRIIIPNDTKMFAQADVENDICYYVTADAESKKLYDMIKAGRQGASFNFININTPCSQMFGMIDFDQNE